jgi:LmbE family N-acetylglucosaminyl deacetylase
MLTLGLGGPQQPLRRLLAIGAHSDDIEIGCGGTILRLVAERPGLEVRWVVLSAHGVRVEEARRSAEAFLAGTAHSRVILETFRDGFFPYQGGEVKEFFETLKDFGPDVVLTHHLGDRHQDHRLVSELTWNTFRDHLVLEYEIPKYDGDLGQPAFYVRLDEVTSRRKVAHLLEHFPSQHGKRWFTEDLFLSLMRLRGMESNAPSRYAEAFFSRKVVV